MKIIQSKAQVYTGYVDGLRQPAYSVHLTFAPAPKDPQSLSENLQCILETIAPMTRPEWYPKAKKLDPEAELARSICIAVARLQDAAGIPVTDAALVEPVPNAHASEASAEGAKTFKVVLPSLDPQVAKIALSWVTILITHLAKNPQQLELTSEQKRMLDLFMSMAAKAAPQGANNARMLRAAGVLDIPVLKLPHGIFQYGWGKNSRLFQSTFSDQTSTIAVQLCSNKDLTKSILGRAGIPLPDGFLANGAKHAVAIAEKLGYPVIVKPADTERGTGITGNLNTAEEVHRAYEKARRYSKHILVERYLAGVTFRVNIYAGRVSSIIKKVPASIFGDGKSTIEQLVNAENKARKMLQAEFAQVKPIKLDQEATALLQAQGFTASSVPDPGTEVFLKKSANVSSGGRLIEYRDPVHPETIEMLERACAVLRLDIGGIDLISDGLDRPWYETETAILEVNSKPQLSAIHFENGQKLLNLYVPNQGHIPTAVLLSSKSQVEDAPDDFTNLFAGTHVGLAIWGRAYLCAHSLQGQETDDMRAANAILMNPSAEGMMLVTDGSDRPNQGFALPFYELLAVGDWTGELSQLEAHIKPIIPFLRGGLLVEKRHPILPILRDLVSPDRLWLVDNRSALLNEIRGHLTK